MNEKEIQHIGDQDLLAQYYESQDNRLLGILLQRYTMLLLGVSMKYLKDEEAAKDSVQQIFLKVIHELKRYRVQYFKSWLYMIARNHCLMQLRKHDIKSTKEINENIFEEEPPLQQHREKEQLLSLIEISLDELNADQKTCITLFYLDKKSYQQISEQTGLSLMQVKSFIQNGKRNLKLLVEKKLRNTSWKI
ncbi:MAG TPA: sigma-70 family RNA polymerase sigma factor [Parafilimonas sp.]|nr:sigma-70 family RNA polymerase sigma factor [Parafilimonas sp.]